MWQASNGMDSKVLLFRMYWPEETIIKMNGIYDKEDRTEHEINRKHGERKRTENTT